MTLVLISRNPFRKLFFILFSYETKPFSSQSPPKNCKYYQSWTISKSAWIPVGWTTTLQKKSQQPGSTFCCFLTHIGLRAKGDLHRDPNRKQRKNRQRGVTIECDTREVRGYDLPGGKGSCNQKLHQNIEKMKKGHARAIEHWRVTNSQKPLKR